MIIFGFHSIEARLKHQADSIQTLWLSESIRHQIRTTEFIELLEELQRKEDINIKIQWSHRDTLTKLAQGSTQHQGIVAQVKAVIHKNWEDLLDDHPFYKWRKNQEEQSSTSSTAKNSQLSQSSQSSQPLPPLLLLLDNVTDPHNVGACLRSANAAGVDVVLAPKDKSCKWNGTVEKVSSGAQTPYILVTNLAQTIEKLQQDYGFLVYGAAGETQLSLYQQTFPKNQPIAWVLGSEGEGLRQLTRKRCDALVKIPMRGEIESLNVSVASSLCIFETMRQWTV